MKDYIKLNILEGSLQVIIESEIPVPKQNEIIYDSSAIFEKPNKQLKSFKVNELVKLYKNSLEYIKEQDMGDYGKGLFTKGLVPRGKIFLPYPGLYISSLIEKEHIVGKQFSKYKLHTDQITSVSEENLGLAHSAQHLPTLENRKNASAICANLISTYVYIKIKYKNKINYLYLILFRNAEDLEATSLLGFDYGLIYWENIKSFYVEWDSRGRVINKIAMLSIEFKGENLALAVSQNPKSEYLQLSELYMIFFPKGILEDIFNPDKLQNNLPIILVSEELVKWIQDKHTGNEKTVLALPILKFLPKNNIKPFLKDNFTKYVVHNNVLYLEIEFLENLTVYELERFIQALNIPEISFLNGHQKDPKNANTNISSELIELFEILNISKITLDNSEQKLESPGSSKFFKTADNQTESSGSEQVTMAKKSMATARK
ncbi:MAG: hypothetical protein RJA25_984 [Bacteroidota bacterium]|jgi:hypothetical protein